MVAVFLVILVKPAEVVREMVHFVMLALNALGVIAATMFAPARPVASPTALVVLLARSVAEDIVVTINVPVQFARSLMALIALWARNASGAIVAIMPAKALFAANRQARHAICLRSVVPALAIADFAVVILLAKIVAKTLNAAPIIVIIINALTSKTERLA